jgi:tetratricopeptide (TPR) repeat protein
LIDARDDRHIWAESFDRDFEQLLSLQREVAREVAAAVEIQLTHQEKQTLSATARIDSEALDAYITGVYYLGQSGGLSSLPAIEQFEEAVRKEPGFAQAYAMLARAYLDAGAGYVQLNREDSIRKARNAASEALALDDSLPFAHSVWGSIAAEEREWDQAERSLRHGYELAPNDPRTMTYFARYLTLAGRHAEAIALEETAVAAAPNDPGIRGALAYSLFADHQFDRALEQGRRLHEMDPDGDRHKWLSYFVHLALGEKEEALRNFIEAVRHTDPESFWVVTAEHHLESVGADGTIRALATMASERVREHGDAAFELGLESTELAYQLAMIGEVDSMFEWLERGNRWREANVIWACIDPVFDPYRSDPRFVDLLERMTCPGG